MKIGNLHKFVLDKLQEHKGYWPYIAYKTGVSIRTIEKIARQEIADPGVRRLQILADYFEKGEKKK